MDSQQAVNLINILLKQNNLPLLSKREETIFCDAWNQLPYHQTAQKLNNSCQYTRYLAWELWKRLSPLFSEPVGKFNIHKTLTQCELANYTPRRKSNQSLNLPHYYQPFPQEETITQEIIREQLQIVGILGMIGTGKSSLAKAITRKIEPNFEIIIWHSFEVKNSSCKEWMKKIIAFITKKKMQSNVTIDEQIDIFLDLLAKKRFLLVFDDLDNLFISQSFPGKFYHQYRSYEKLIKRIVTQLHQSCVIFTSRHYPQFFYKELQNFSQFKTCFLNGLSANQVDNFLKAWGLPRRNYLLEQFQLEYDRNPWALEKACFYIHKHYNGNLRHFLCDQHLIFPEILNDLSHEFKRLNPLEKKIMYLLRDQIQPSSKMNLFAKNLKASKAEINLALKSLQARSLIKLDTGFIFLSPLLQQYLRNRKSRQTGKIKKSALSA